MVVGAACPQSTLRRATSTLTPPRWHAFGKTTQLHANCAGISRMDRRVYANLRMWPSHRACHEASRILRADPMPAAAFTAEAPSPGISARSLPDQRRDPGFFGGAQRPQRGKL